MRKLLPALTILALFGTTIASDDNPLQFASGAHQIALIELYTSEGCSSCPPADHWMSDLKSDGRLWQDFVPIALHVDYWNYIGWHDRFSKAEYTGRQRKYVDDGHASTVYTPGFFSNGEEWRGWFGNQELAIEKASVGNLSVAIDRSSIAIRFDPPADFGDELVANFALLGMQLESDVQAGENRGKTLRHDFVALNVQAVDMKRAGSGYKALAELEDVGVKNTELALAAWISKKGDQKPLQAVGGYLR